MAVSKKIIRTESLSTDRVNGEVDEDIITCPICINILWKPVTCKICENSFCLKCIRLWLKEKPNSCPFNCQFQERKPPPILIKLLSKLKLNCQYKSNGCSLLIPYEALEKHELSECLFRLTQCPDCSKEMLYRDLENHQNQDCLPKQLTCLKCNTIYNQSEGHEDMECLKKQMIMIDEVQNVLEKGPEKIIETYTRMLRLYKRQELNNDYARRTHMKDYIVTPSAPVYEPPSESLRISTINFSINSQSKNEGSHVPNGYAGFNWENIYYMLEQDIQKNPLLTGFLKAYTNSRKCVAYNGKGKPLSIFLPNSHRSFGLHSFEAMSIYHENFKLTVTSYRSNVVFGVKNIILTKTKPTLFEINWEQIDKITFTPERIVDTGKPETFALICLNLIL